MAKRKAAIVAAIQPKEEPMTDQTTTEAPKAKRTRTPSDKPRVAKPVYFGVRIKDASSGEYLDGGDVSIEFVMAAKESNQADCMKLNAAARRDPTITLFSVNKDSIEVL